MDLIRQAEAYLREHAIEEIPPAPSEPTPWDEWTATAAVLRSVPMRVGRLGHGQPMTWDEVAKWFHKRDPRARRYKAASLICKLSARVKKLNEK